MEANLQGLEKLIAESEAPLLVEFWSSWCPPCQMMKQTLEEFEKEFQERIKLVKINPDINPAVSSKYNIMGLPTFAVFHKGKEIKREVGAKSKEQLKLLIETI